MAPRAAARLESLGFTKVHEYKAGKQDWLATGLAHQGRRSDDLTVASVMRLDVPRFGLEDRVGPIRERLKADGWEWAAIVNRAGILLGRVRRDDITDPEAVASSVMDEGPSTYRLNVGLDELLERMDDGQFGMAFVTDPDGKLRGLVTRRDMIKALNEHHRAS